jgi:NAD(P)-dependent dehydrogenase (short-subunit alcohol dehydrogenase family)
MSRSSICRARNWIWPGSRREVALCPCDLTDEAQVRRKVCAEIVASRPGRSISSSTMPASPRSASLRTCRWKPRKVFEVNYFGAVNVAAELVAGGARSRGAHLAISSVAGFAPLHRRSAYSASKHALEGFFRTLASEEKPYGVRVHIAAPSFVATNLGNPDSRDGGIARPGSATDGVDYMEPGRSGARHPRRRSPRPWHDPGRPRRAHGMVDQPPGSRAFRPPDGTQYLGRAELGGLFRPSSPPGPVSALRSCGCRASCVGTGYLPPSAPTRSSSDIALPPRSGRGRNRGRDLRSFSRRR